MSIKTKVFAASAALTLIGGFGAVAATSASAATPSCGHSCIDVFSKLYGGTHHNPGFVMDVQKQTEKAGTPIILYRQSNSDPAEDFTVSYQGTVDDFYAAGLVSSSLDLHYGNDDAFEVQYSPYGVDSGLCTGTTGTALPGTKVALEPCGTTSKTIWVVDASNVDFTSNGPFVPLVNGSDTNFSQPYSLTYPENSYPTDSPRPQLYVTNLTGSFSSGTIQDNQLWSADFGTLP